MSVQELRLKEGSSLIVVKHVSEGCFTFDTSNGLTFNQIGLDRNQAHLLMLYLQEHLK